MNTLHFVHLNFLVKAAIFIADSFDSMPELEFLEGELLEGEFLEGEFPEGE